MIGPVALVGAMVVVGSVVLYNVMLARHTEPSETGGAL